MLGTWIIFRITDAESSLVNQHVHVLKPIETASHSFYYLCFKAFPNSTISLIGYLEQLFFKSYHRQNSKQLPKIEFESDSKLDCSTDIYASQESTTDSHRVDHLKPLNLFSWKLPPGAVHDLEISDRKNQYRPFPEGPARNVDWFWGTLIDFWKVLAINFTWMSDVILLLGIYSLATVYVWIICIDLKSHGAKIPEIGIGNTTWHITWVIISVT